MNIALEVVALNVGLRPLLVRAAERHLSAAQMLWRGTDPAATTVVLTSAAGVVGGLLALAGLVLTQVTGRTAPDTFDASIVSAAAALRRTWPAVAYVYLNPVAQSRPRRSTEDGTAVLPHRASGQP